MRGPSVIELQGFGRRASGGFGAILRCFSGLAVQRSVSSTGRSEGCDNGHLVPGVERFALEGLLASASPIKASS